MSQNQSYFWQTTRHNVYLRRSAKLQMLLALLAVLTYATICMAEVGPDFGNDGVFSSNAPIIEDDSTQPMIINKMYNAENEIPNMDAKKDVKQNTGFIDAFTASISVILFTELGDKTFFIAAIMAMRHPRLIVFAGAISALALMTILSVVFGMAATIIPKVYTYYISTALFAIFGLKMVYDGYKMKDTDAQEELEEVQSDLRKREDELMRTARAKYDNTEGGKRKNSDSDKEEDVDADVESGAGATLTTQTTLPNIKNPEMQHRQRKQLNTKLSKINNNNNNNTKTNGCDDNIDIDEFNETDRFLNGHAININNLHNNSTLSSPSVESNQTEQTTNCDEIMYKDDKSDENHSTNRSKRNYGNKLNNNKTDQSTATVHSTSSSATATAKNGNIIMGKSNSINSLSNISLNSVGAAGQSNVELNMQTGGGTNNRLERDVSATVVQDPESGVIRKTPKKSATYLTTRVLMQAFTMTFLAEWGDRSQLTTIILAASKNVYGVITGGIIGHSICTGLAVIGGRMVAAKISLRTVTIVGGIVFLGFAFYALIARPDDI